ncbi:MAG: hypothetical protein KA257_06420 [Opitutaceae bacterium]|nr:hypothetical protein [Opitutaceae bacterium]MBP9912246.1 hypothetical protein [Opitutaceae bacterium]
MTARAESLLHIRHVLDLSGPADAFAATRAAFEDGRIDALDVPEVFLALRAQSGNFFESLSARAPGGSRFPFSRR